MHEIPDTRRELATLLKSRIPLIIIETRDEPRVLEHPLDRIVLGGVDT